MLQFSITTKVKDCTGFHYLLTKKAVCFDSFQIEYIPQDVLNNIKDQLIARNIFRIKSNYFIMCDSIALL